MKTFLKKMVIGLALVAGISAEAQFLAPPVIWTYSSTGSNILGNYIGGGLFTNAVLASGTSAAATNANTIGSTSPSLTNFMVGGLTNVTVQFCFDLYTNVGSTAVFGSPAYVTFQGSKDYVYWNNMGSGYATNATWVTDTNLVLNVIELATNTFANLNAVGVPTNGSSGQTNFNVSGYVAIRPYSMGTGQTNLSITNPAVLLYWRQ